MSVKNTHPAYDKYAPLWKTMRDVCAGQTAVHQAGPAYLPRLSEQSDAEYAAYKGRALFYNATWRTVAGMIGIGFACVGRFSRSAPGEREQRFRSGKFELGRYGGLGAGDRGAVAAVGSRGHSGIGRGLSRVVGESQRALTATWNCGLLARTGRAG